MKATFWSFDDLVELYNRLLPHDERINRTDFARYWKSIRHVVEDRPPATKGSLMYLTDCARIMCATFGC